jgi:hypothetical protein
MTFARSLFRIFPTKKGHLGWAPRGMQVGDVVCVCANSSYPIILRKKDDGYSHVGLCFVLGLMYGERAEMAEKGELREEDFEIHYADRW